MKALASETGPVNRTYFILETDVPANLASLVSVADTTNPSFGKHFDSDSDSCLELEDVFDFDAELKKDRRN